MANHRSRLPFDRFEAMMLGLAIGDSLGNTSESKLPDERRFRFGEITGYLVNRRFGDARGYPSDDSQMAFWTLDHLLVHGRIVPEQLAATFSGEQIFGIGSTVREFSENFRSGRPWEECGVCSAGNGALMRIAPLLYHLLAGQEELLESDTRLATRITHNDSMAIAASCACVQLLADCAVMSRVPEPEWWPARFIEELKARETRHDYRSRSPHYPEFEGSLAGFLEIFLSRAHARSGSLPDVLDCYSGAYLLETVPSVLLILMRYAGDPEQAILRAVNDTKDNDTVAAIVGAFLGALHGRGFLRADWVRDLTGRTKESDDGEVFRILERARLAASA